METRIFKINDITSGKDKIKEAGHIIRNGGVVVFPTETVYGIGANALDSEAVKKIFKAKNRPADNPLIVHITKTEDIYDLAENFPERARILTEAFWPGPLTVILPKKECVPDITSAGLSSVAVRMPRHEIARALINFSGVPIAAPSANISGKPSPTSGVHVVNDMLGRVDAIIEAGSCEVGVESTVLSLLDEVPVLLRPGAVTKADIESLIGEIKVHGGGNATEKVISPGMKYRHYAPEASAVLVHAGSEKFKEFALKHKETGTFFMAFNEDAENFSADFISYGSGDNPASQAKNLFSALRLLDIKKAKKVYIRLSPNNNDIGAAVYNRLLRAAQFNEIYL